MEYWQGLEPGIPTHEEANLISSSFDARTPHTTGPIHGSMAWRYGFWSDRKSSWTAVEQYLQKVLGGATPIQTRFTTHGAKIKNGSLSWFGWETSPVFHSTCCICFHFFRFKWSILFDIHWLLQLFLTSSFFVALDDTKLLPSFELTASYLHLYSAKNQHAPLWFEPNPDQEIDSCYRLMWNGAENIACLKFFGTAKLDAITKKPERRRNSN